MLVRGGSHRPTLRIGIIGLGRAAVSMLPSLVAHPHVKVVAAADLREEAREAFARDFRGEAYGSAEGLCQSPNLDAVYIATPHAFHAPHAILAAQNGKHAIVEKPMALTIPDCEAMIAAAEHHGTKLLVGHTHGFDPAIIKMREIVRSGKLGRLGMINTWNFTDFVYRPRRPDELDPRLGGGIVFNQVPHQVDMVRLIGGGLVRSVRSVTGTWDKSRPIEGSHATFLEFVDGAAATLVYSGYDHFDTDELHFWTGEGGNPKSSERQGRTRAATKGMGAEEESEFKARTGYGGSEQKHPTVRKAEIVKHHPHFGIIIVSCERGDMRPSPDGVFIYGDEGKKEILVPLGRAVPDKGNVVDEFYDAVVNDREPIHDGRWGEATLEVCLAILESAKERKEVPLSYQVPIRD